MTPVRIKVDRFFLNTIRKVMYLAWRVSLTEGEGTKGVPRKEKNVSRLCSIPPNSKFHKGASRVVVPPPKILVCIGTHKKTPKTSYLEENSSRKLIHPPRKNVKH